MEKKNCLERIIRADPRTVEPCLPSGPLFDPITDQGERRAGQVAAAAAGESVLQRLDTAANMTSYTFLVSSVRFY